MGSAPIQANIDTLPFQAQENICAPLITKSRRYASKKHGIATNATRLNNIISKFWGAKHFMQG